MFNNNSFNIQPKKSISYFSKQRKSKFNSNGHSLINEESKINNFNSFNKNKKKELNLPKMKNHISKYNKTRKSLSNSFYNSKRKIPNIKNNIFPTSINETFYRNKKSINNSMKGTLTESNIGNSKYSSNNNIFFEPDNSSKINEENKIFNKNSRISRFKEYQNFMETSSSLIKSNGRNLSNDIKNNPFMRKIEDLNKINQFEIVFHNNIMNNIKKVYEKTKKGFFKIEYATKSKDLFGTGYVCENQNNIFSVSDMIERMNPISTLKFSNLLRKDYKEFLGYNKRMKRKRKEDDLLRKRVINKYHRELFFQNEFADKYNIKKNSGIKFIIDDEDNNKKKKEDNINNIYY